MAREGLLYAFFFSSISQNIFDICGNTNLHPAVTDNAIKIRKLRNKVQFHFINVIKILNKVFVRTF